MNNIGNQPNIPIPKNQALNQVTNESIGGNQQSAPSPTMVTATPNTAHSIPNADKGTPFEQSENKNMQTEQNSFGNIENTDNLDEKTLSSSSIVQQTCLPQDIAVKNTTSTYDLQTKDNKLVDEIFSNDTALSIAKEKFDELKNQKQLAVKMGKVVDKKANADIESADLKVGQQKVANNIERARQKNEILSCKQERKFLKRESKHRLTMQKFQQRKEKYGDLLLRYCRKKTKNAKGEWEYLTDSKGDSIINMPSALSLGLLLILDSFVMFLNQTAEVFSGINKAALKIFWIVIICLIIFVPSIRGWFFGLIGFGLG